MTRRIGARELIAVVLDRGSFASWDEELDGGEWRPEYRQQLLRAAERSGLDESVVTGEGRIDGRPVCVIVNDFNFLAGSIGADAVDRLVRGFRRATERGLPVLASTSSGGTRMQEGTPAFVGMVEVTRAVMAHRASGLPFLVYLRHPTTGGVFASWGSLGHATVAEPGALIGFLGPKVYEALKGRHFPAGVQTAENLARRGIIDAVVEVADLRDLVDHTLRTMVDEARPPYLPRRVGAGSDSGPQTALTDDPPLDAWASVQATRSPERPGVREVLRIAGESTVRLRGTQQGERDETVIVALTRWDGQPCVVIGQDRARQSEQTPMGPAALRQARRAMRLAEELRLPLLSVIDTPGAELSRGAEEGSMAGEIARCLATMTAMTVPTVSLLMGQGCGGGALALLPANVVIAASNAWLAPLPPEGASVILHGLPDHAAEMARNQRVRATDLHAEGIVHHVVAERPGESAAELAVALAAECAYHLDRLATGENSAVLDGVGNRPRIGDSGLESVTSTSSSPENH